MAMFQSDNSSEYCKLYFVCWQTCLLCSLPHPNAALHNKLHHICITIQQKCPFIISKCHIVWDAHNVECHDEDWNVCDNVCELCHFYFRSVQCWLCTFGRMYRCWLNLECNFCCLSKSHDWNSATLQEVVYSDDLIIIFWFNMKCHYCAELWYIFGSPSWQNR